MQGSQFKSRYSRMGLGFPSILLMMGLMAGCATVNYQAPSKSVTGEYLAGRLAVRTNDLDSAARSYATVQAFAPGDTSLAHETFRYSLLTGDFETAKRQAEKLVRVGKGREDPLIHLTLAAEDMRSKRYKAARTQLSLLGTDNVFETASFLMRGWAIAGDEGPLAAIAHINNPAPDAFTGFSPLHVGLLYEKANKAGEARVAYQQAFVTLGGPVGQRAFTAFLERQKDKAIAQEVNQLLAQQRGPMRRVGLRNLERLEDGRVSRDYANTTPAQGSAVVLYGLATAITEQIYSQRDAAVEAGFTLRDPDLSQPMALAQLAIAMDPEFEEAVRYIGSINNVMEQYDVAIETLSRIKPSSPYYEQAQIDIAGAFVAQENQSAAINVLQKLVDVDPEAQDARLVLAASLSEEGEYERAVEVLAPSIERLQNAPRADGWRFLIARADSLVNLDRFPEAEKDLKQALTLAPEEATVLNYLGYSWAERGINLEEAFELLEKAQKKEPRSGAIIDSLGWAHFKLGQYDEAVVNLEKAVSLEPSDPTITDHLGDVYWKIGRQNEARYEWRRALELSPDDKLKLVLEDKLENGLTGGVDDS